MLWLLTTALSLLGILFGSLRRARSSEGMSDAYLRVDAEGIRIKQLLSGPRRFPWEQEQRVWLRGSVVEVDLRDGLRERCVVKPPRAAGGAAPAGTDLLGRYSERHDFALTLEDVESGSG